ncbi:MAG: FMN-binding protein [Methylococcales bacterium]
MEGIYLPFVRKRSKNAHDLPVNMISRFTTYPSRMPVPVILFWLLFSNIANAAIYQQPTDFLNEVLVGEVPKPSVLWLSKPLRQHAKEILSHPPGFLRTRYWKKQTKTVWILDEIGKSEPITVGIVIDNGEISLIKVLAFHESRGWEVKHDFFTNQFKGLFLNSEQKLNRHIDGISGATLSVRALKKVAALALLFNKFVSE